MESMEQPPERQIEADSLDSADSGIGSDVETTYTASIRSEFLQSMKENGRGYHRYRDGIYILPDDEREQERLDMQHAMFCRSFGNRLYLAPIERPIKEVLDLGTGTGIWCIDMADELPEANILGVDLSPIQPTWVPPNCKFELDDFDAQWTFDKKFDLIHGRMMITSSADFPRLFQQSFEFLQPGGFLELQDVVMPLGCDDGTMDGTAIGEWNQKFVDASIIRGRDVHGAARYKDWLTEAGYEDVVERTFKWPINPWAKDPELKSVGRWNEVNMLDGLEGFCVRLFSSTLGMTMDEIQTFLIDVRKDISNRKIHVYWQM
ncbi:hypothetical protein PRZ48_003145 [Zasmidium cellare]|uniref:Methyltransferase n=1 Tax=Zasmidium cellare TaxID=395010 RepID=A0ABR0EUC0_ZASCE|nr:hypothetical protein PRZ48_003145 [Zasmidium cellare]